MQVKKEFFVCKGKICMFIVLHIFGATCRLLVQKSQELQRVIEYIIRCLFTYC